MVHHQAESPHVRFRGQLFVDDRIGVSGLPVELALMDRQLAVRSDDETIGKYPLSETRVERIGGERFKLAIGSESLIFVADDALGFSYEAMPFISAGGTHPTSTGLRRFVQKVLRGPERAVTLKEPEVAAPPPVRVEGAEVTPGIEEVGGAPSPDEPWPQSDDVVQPTEMESASPGESAPPDHDRPDPDLDALRRCEGALSDGSRCPMEPRPGSVLCYTHAGQLEKQRLDLDRRTVRAAEGAARVGLPNLDDVLERLEKAVAQVHEGTLAPQQAMAMASLVQAMVETIELSGAADD